MEPGGFSKKMNFRKNELQITEPNRNQKDIILMAGAGTCDQLTHMFNAIRRIYQPIYRKLQITKCNNLYDEARPKQDKYYKK